MSQEDLTEIFTSDRPLGPINSDVIPNSYFNALISKNNFLYNEIASNPSLIVGRRGSGKTTYLRLAYHSAKDKIIIELKPEDGFRQIVLAIEKMGSSIVFAEEVANLWSTLLWNLVFTNLVKRVNAKKSENLAILRKYTEGQKISNSNNPYKIMHSVLNAINGYANAGEDISENIDRLSFQGVSFESAKEAAIAFMKENSIRTLILMDNLDDFPYDNETMAHALTGLLKCQGAFSIPGCRCTLRFCLPAELYFPFLEISSNVNKDFQHQLLLHWHAAELLQLSAERLLQYLKLYHSDVYKPLSHLDLNSRKEVKDFWEMIFPKVVKNKLGTEERTTAYVLRHTQLLPRHMLMFLNEICQESDGQELINLKDRPESIVKGLHSKERLLCNEILNAFKYRYPQGLQICERCIPYLPLQFAEGELLKVFMKHGMGFEKIHDFDDFKKMFFELGVIGVVIPPSQKEDSDTKNQESNRVNEIKYRYIRGLFEYTAENKLVSSSYDELCLHPLFTEVFRATKKENQLPIYPFGADINEPDWRLI
jgi:hypothetical protein